MSRPIALTCAILVAISACASDPVAPGTISALPRPLTDAEAFVGSAGNRFSFDLLRQVNLAQQDENVFLSPLSASMALGMTLNGAAGATADEMRRALGFGEVSEQSINDGYRGLIGLLRGLDRSTDVRVANAIFHRHDYPFEQSFLETGRRYFDAEVRGLDFAAPATLGTINDWVSRGTNGKIPTILDRITPNEVMFLINAVYFKGSWRSRFDPRATADAEFRTIDGSSQPMKLMYQKTANLRYLETADFQAVDLLYGNSAYAMTVLLPKPETNVNALVASLSDAAWAEWSQGFEEQEVELYLPKLKLEYERTLNEDLQALGMRLAFDGADFSRMSPRGRGLEISYVKQKTFVDIHEEGPEAAAATVVAVIERALPSSVMRVDRPFLFAIRERFSGTILFVGKIVRMPASGG